MTVSSGTRQRRRRTRPGTGVSFEAACKVFQDRFAIEFVDDRQDYGEDRFILIGMAARRVLVVVYTMRGERIRLISARGAEPFEQRQYHEQSL